MGSICHINTNPKTWVAFDSGLKLKPEFGGESLMTVRYGTFDDDPDGICDMEMYMRTSVYEGLLNGTYTVSPDSKWQHRLIVLDTNGQIVPSVGGSCY